MKSLASKLVVLITAVIVLLTVAFTVFHVLHIGILLKQRRIVNGLALVDIVAHQVGRASLADEAEHFKSSLDAVMADPRIIYVVVYDSEGNILGQTSRVRLDLSLPKKGVKELTSIAQPMTLQQRDPVGEDIYEFYAPVTLQQEDRIIRAAGLVRLGMSTADILSAQHNSVELAVAMGLVILGFGSLVTFSISRRVTKPLAELKKGAKGISDGNLNYTLPILSNDEIGELARTFNSMTQALRETTVSKNYVDNIVNSMKEILVVLSFDLNIKAINKSAEELSGFSSSELIGLPANTIFPEGVAIQFKGKGWRDFIAGKHGSAVETKFKTKDGTLIPVNFSTAPMLNSGGEIIDIVCVARDMRETNEFLAQLKARTEELENYQSALVSMLEDNEKTRTRVVAEHQKTLASVNAMSEGIVMFSQEGEVILLNVSARSILNLENSEEVNLNIIARLTGLDMSIFLSPATDTASLRLSRDIITNKATKHVVRAEGTVVMSEGEKVGSMLILRDITRERQLDDAKHELIGNVSHELRTPLSSIKNAVSNILAGVVGSLSEDLRRHMEVCHMNVQRLGLIVDNLIDLASLDSGEMRIHRSLVDFAALVREVCRSLQPEIEQKGIRLNTNLPDTPIELYCDASAVEQAITHLARNAIRFTPENGDVGISVKESQSQVEVSVIDSGVGIPVEDQHSVFTGFHQVGRTYGPGVKGLGLGLPICRQLIEMHGGSIGVTSALNRGSCFSFQLPRLAGEELVVAYIDDSKNYPDEEYEALCLWMLAPKMSGASVDPALRAVAYNMIEAAVRRTAKVEGSIVTQDVHHEGVFFVARIKMIGDAAELDKALALATKHISFGIGDQTIDCETKMARVSCKDPNITSKQHIAAVKKLAVDDEN